MTLCPSNGPVTDLVYAGTIVEGMGVTDVVHETSNITGGVWLLQELCLHVYLIKLQRREGCSGHSQGQIERDSDLKKIPMGATYDKVLFLVTDLYSIYDIRAEGTAGIAFILLKQKKTL